MRRRLPPLNAIVAFESAARHKSFKKAGDELCVTSSAISHQVRSLEDWLGFNLFERSTRVIELTDFGIRYVLALSSLLDQLEKFSNNEIVRGKNKTIITIQTTDSFASRWLIPRLSEFESLHPDIVIKIITYDFRDSLRCSEADLGILFMADKKHNAKTHNVKKYNQTENNDNMRLLFAEQIFPVCSPEIIQNMTSIGVADLSNFTLIHDDNVGVSWQDWISTATEKHFDATNMKTKNGPHYNHAHLALKSAELGNGFTLASNVLTSDALEKGLLVAPFQDKIVTGCGYYLTQSQNPKVRNYCRPFSKWIVARAC
ncbi:LysR family transcriptional regulator [Candidatus Spongiihabitans sp.]|uniref:LysR family transcriptional regulator n=1 Tax=Candidatus Spongiihabitans sp. TaxID=3101308 RepID=UPI003C7CD503